MITIGFVTLGALIGVFYLCGTETLREYPHQPNASEMAYPHNLLIQDAWFDISEYRPDALKNRTLIHTVDDELQVFPDLGEIFRKADTDTGSWSVIGQRYSGGFDGNMSEYLNFVHIVCKNATPDVCFANPPLYEYSGRYFTVSPEYYHSHSTASPTRNGRTEIGLENYTQTGARAVP